jgi:hypothetical protein
MKPTLSIVLVFLLLVSVTASLGFYSMASTELDSAFPQLSMPTEHVNYTIAQVNGSLWAKIDGEYPIYLSQSAAYLPVLYPMPPNSTNIHLLLDNEELGWSNYTQISPAELHKTAIGDWWMIEGNLKNVPDHFVLKIHYEHPIEKLNGSYLLLYDLNIADYLSAANPTSTAYFTLHFESNLTDIHVYTAPPDSTASQWQSKDFTTAKEGSSSVITVKMQSKLGTMLPGDLAIVFSDTATENNTVQSSEEPPWVIPVVLDVVLISILLYVKRKTVSAMFSSK